MDGHLYLSQNGSTIGTPINKHDADLYNICKLFFRGVDQDMCVDCAWVDFARNYYERI